MVYSTEIRLLLIGACLGAALLGGSAAGRRLPDRLAAPLETIDTEIAGWTAAEQQLLPPPIIEKLQPSSYISRTYRKQDRELNLFVAYYAQQRAGETMHSPKVCLPGNGWEIEQQGSAMILVDRQRTRVNQYHVQNSGRHQLVLYWYQSQKRVIASEYLGKVLLIRDALMSGHISGSIVRITLTDEPSSAKEGAAFAEAVIPQVQRCLAADYTPAAGSSLSRTF